MLTPEELQKENDRLKAELATYQAAQKAQQQQKGNFIKRLGSIGSWFFLGGDLKQSIKQLVIEARDKNQTISDDTLGNVLAHGAWRLTRIGCFAVLVALIPLLILMIQTTLLYYQNNKSKFVLIFLYNFFFQIFFFFLFFFLFFFFFCSIISKLL